MPFSFKLPHLSLAPLLQLFMAQPPRPNLPHIFPDHDYSVSPKLWLLGLKSMDGEAEKCYTSKITYFKRQKGSRHEFLVVDIVHPSSGQVAHAVTDRAPKKFDNDGSKDKRTKQAIAPSISGSVAANDTVQFSGGRDVSKRASSDKLAEVTFEPGKLPVIHFAILLTTIGKHAPDYSIWKYQCYWYADTVYESTKALFEVRGEHTEDILSKVRGEYALGLPLMENSIPAIRKEYLVALEQYQEEEVNKEEARRAKENNVSFLNSKAFSYAYVLAADRATWP